MHILQLLAYNLLSVILILIFNYRWSNGKIPTGYLMLGILFCLNGITLGTWSFTNNSAAPDLSGRLLRQFDLLRRSGFWEMTGMLVITCASSRVSCKNNLKRAFPLSLLNKAETIALFSGLGLILCGAVIESVSILYQ